MKCFCNNEMSQKLINNKSFFECEKCGYLMKENIVSKEEEKERYDAHICDDSYILYMKNVYETIKNFVAGDCLDFGCGKVHALADILVENGYNSDYYDLYYYSEKKNKKYDTIILIEVFEHIADTLGLMNELKGMLNDNGRIIIMTKTKKEPLDKWWYLRDVTHIRFVENKTMEVLANMLDMRLVIKNDLFIFFK